MILEFVDGIRVSSREATGSDIDQAADFLVKLRELSNSVDSHLLPLASEACFSVRSIIDSIEQRLHRLRQIRCEVTLQQFLENEFAPSLRKVIEGCKVKLGKLDMPFDVEIETEMKTLSPSDFGFHNALERPDGHMIFLDFEHFGWDDPAKMIADFLIHPGMSLDENLKARFLQRVLNGFEDRGYLAKRVEVVHPLFTLKWCMILLNEFSPEHLHRRTFAYGADLDRHSLQCEQLEKARRMLHSIGDGHGDFPNRN